MDLGRFSSADLMLNDDALQDNFWQSYLNTDTAGSQSPLAMPALPNGVASTATAKGVDEYHVHS